MDLPNELTVVLDGKWGGLLRELRVQMAGVEVRDGSGLIPGPYLGTPSLDGGEVAG